MKVYVLMEYEVLHHRDYVVGVTDDEAKAKAWDSVCEEYFYEEHTIE